MQTHTHTQHKHSLEMYYFDTLTKVWPILCSGSCCCSNRKRWNEMLKVNALSRIMRVLFINNNCLLINTLCRGRESRGFALDSDYIRRFFIVSKAKDQIKYNRLYSALWHSWRSCHRRALQSVYRFAHKWRNPKTLIWFKHQRKCWKWSKERRKKLRAPEKD